MLFRSRCLDRLVEHKDDLNKFLCRRWGELFGAKFDVLLYDLTSTYFESDVQRSQSSSTGCCWNPLRMTLPEQPPPKITAKQVRKNTQEATTL